MSGKQRWHHGSIDVKGMLRNFKKPGSLDGLFIGDDGNHVSDAVARNYLLKNLIEGKTIIPASSSCDNYDYKAGRCLGHDGEPE